jgi:hypothetical protein
MEMATRVKTTKRKGHQDRNAVTSNLVGLQKDHIAKGV